VEAEWSRASSLLEAPPVDCSLTLEATLEDEADPAEGAGRELLLLDGLARGLAGEGVTWLGAEGPPLARLLQELLEGVREAGPRAGGLSRLERTEALDQAGLGVQSIRQETDFTDELWTVLSRATSYAELTEALRTVFDTIATEELRPFLYAKNKTGVARAVQAVARDGAASPDLTGSRPLQLLVECGLEKVRRDLSHTLLAGELAGREQVARLLGAEGEPPGRAVESLVRLHRVVRLAGLTQTLLDLPTDCLRGLVQAALASLQDTGAAFTFPLPPGAVTQQLARMRPATWQVGRSS
jgi:hypothetical protein